MAQKTYPSSFDSQPGLGTDYALIALIYLILI